MPVLEEHESMRSMQITDEELRWVAVMTKVKIDLWDLQQNLRGLHRNRDTYTDSDIEGLYQEVIDISSIIGDE